MKGMKSMSQLNFEENLLTKVAWYYYKDQLTQQEIASLLHISRNKVVRLLDKARSEGIVTFHVKGTGLHCLSIERDLMKKFHLKDAFIIPTPINNYATSLGKAAAQYLETHLQQGDLLGIGWGETISKMLENIHFESSINISFVTLTGGVNHYLPRKQNYLHYMQGDLHIIPTPFLASSTEMAQSILSEPSVKDMLHVASLAHTAVVGIGGLSQDATIVKEEKLTLREMTYIRSQNGAGDILGQFYNTNGDLLELSHHNRLIGTPLTILRSMKHVIGVAGGTQKIDAIYGALKGKFIHTLITDEETALSLLRKEGDS
ncbi:sugar-binding transcriptional regulator [Bacillus thuringiensis]|nr:MULTISPECIES: sugar-binding transcriptional regulator [Bacillus cereus group]MCC6081599.1 sugar-binding transcriptional regulator [Bacillus thuringiensis]MED3352388.1 sugar-binding transcriptional regulator [Bacillus thuringiensis]MRB12346.1 sugar-binding transcriptional regulator [Bacillus thuringiensis]HDR8063457.1 sugar-binding transcriptional regulator [Bacillus cereus]HDX9494096.1 sugar-binding transcriptional regulator [Bacillus thuringiensis]